MTRGDNSLCHSRDVKRLPCVVITDVDAVGKAATSKGNVVVFDSQHAPFISQHRLSEYPTGYVRIVQNQKGHRLHRVLAERMRIDTSQVIDHINANRRDNRSQNLRAATLSQNNFNARNRTNNTSGYKGVSWDAKTNKWKAAYRKNYFSFVVGYFKELPDAVEAVRRARLEAHGEFANHG